MSGQHRLGLAHARVPRVSRLAFTVLLAIPLALLALAPLAGRAAAHPTAPRVPACCTYNGSLLPVSTLHFHSMLSSTGTPTHLATDAQGNLYVADTWANRVLMYGANDSFVRYFGTGNKSSNPGDFNTPAGIAVSGNSVFVVDSGNHRIQVFNQSTGAYVSEFGDSHLTVPVGMALGTNGQLYVSDVAPTVEHIAIFTTAGVYQTSFGSPGTGDGQFETPLCVTASPLGQIIVCDYSNNRTEEFDLSGTLLATQPFYTGPTGAAVDRAGIFHVVDQTGDIGRYSSPVLSHYVPGNLYTPFDIAVTNVPNTPISVYVSDPNSSQTALGIVQRFDLVVNPQAHNYQAQWGSSGAGNGQFNASWDTAVDSAGNVYVTDVNNNRVQKFDQFGNFMFAFGGAGGGNGQFNGPIGLAINPTDNSVYVTDSGNNRIEQFNASGTYLTQWGALGSGTGQFNNPRAVATDGTSVYVVDSNNARVQMFSTSGAYQYQFGTLGTGNSQFDHPAGVAIDDRTGELFVADTGNSRVEAFTRSGIYITSYSNVSELNAETGAISMQNFSFPEGLAVDGRGDLYIADRGNDSIDQIETTYPAAVPFGDWYGSAGSGNGQFAFATGVAVSPTNGQIYVADALNNRIQRLGSPWPKNDTIGIYRPSTKTFYLRLENSTGPAEIVVPMSYALPGDLPVVGDWEGDGVDTVGLYRSSTGTFLLQDANVPESAPDYVFTLGISGDTPIAGDWTGDGKFGAGVFRPSNGILYTRDTLSTGYADNNMVMGINGDKGISGDWNGDGQDSPGVYRPSNQTFYVTDKVTNGIVYADHTATLGIPGDVPFTGDWLWGNGGFASGIGVFRPSNGITYEKNVISTGFADNFFIYGIAGDIPVAGQWVPTFISFSPHAPSHHPAGGSTPKAPAKGPGSATAPKPTHARKPPVAN